MGESGAETRLGGGGGGGEGTGGGGEGREGGGGGGVRNNNGLTRKLTGGMCSCNRGDLSCEPANVTTRVRDTVGVHVYIHCVPGQTREVTVYPSV